MTTSMPCPRCGKKVCIDGPHAVPERPFCSARCRLLDLGDWSEGAHKVSRPLSYKDVDEIL